MHDDYQFYNPNRMIQDYAPCHADTTGAKTDYLIKTVDKPVAVHVFNHQVIIVGSDGTVLTLVRR